MIAGVLEASTLLGSRTASIMAEDEVLTLPVAARRFRVSYGALRKAAYRGRLPAQKVGRDWLVTVRAVQAWLAQAPHTPGAAARQRHQPITVTEPPAAPAPVLDRGLVPLARAAWQLGIVPATLRKAAYEGQLLTHKLGRDYLVRVVDVVAWQQHRGYQQRRDRSEG